MLDAARVVEGLYANMMSVRYVCIFFWLCVFCCLLAFALVIFWVINFVLACVCSHLILAAFLSVPKRPFRLSSFCFCYCFWL